MGEWKRPNSLAEWRRRLKAVGISLNIHPNDWWLWDCPLGDGKHSIISVGAYEHLRMIEEQAAETAASDEQPSPRIDWRPPKDLSEWRSRLRAVGLELAFGERAFFCPLCKQNHPLDSLTGHVHFQYVENERSEGAPEERSSVTLEGDESEAMEAVNRAAGIIFGWRPRGNQTELSTAVHTLQGFIVQHMLARLNPDDWTPWYETQQPEEES